ncbi:molybdopterin-dependent oxidoreductase [Kaistia dalseonensis]|uniref:Nicotinate dehydrogenase subunit B n=1 Tax=Kaistia dalseonensis TaxID=410840 RepID=A0ABU0H4J2_9HYPH|nr:molybdopterin cofactor-binding domain-containing protein [Kaistia dalseonensis]MCX5494204.1 molybdopterin-dependent oxidoreductase [Kaistia dalseonensis]MDQ0436783.1 nicotinate dehydrogenase subunit B [Kaistia dalseonensis]
MTETPTRMETPYRRALLQRSGVLAIVERRTSAADALDPDALDLHLCLTEEGAVYAFNGHVDLGTGIRTALAQIVAEELDVAIDTVTMALGDTDNTPDQGPTIASETIQISARPLRIAAAQARLHLLGLAADMLDRPTDDLVIRDGILRSREDARIALPFGELLQNRQIHLLLDPETPVKDVADYRIVGRSVGRVDIPDKVTGSFVYVHDVRVPGMLHGRVVRPPYSGIDAGDFVGRSLEEVDKASIAHVPGVVAVVVQGDFIGVVCEREEQAIEAAAALKVTWKPWVAGADLGHVENALRAQPVQSRRLVDEGDVDAALAIAGHRLDRTYVWPYQMHGSIGPSCAVADFQPNGLRVWSGTQNPYPMRTDLALLMGLAEERIEVIRIEAAGCYGRNCADDVTADAALLSRGVGRPVRVQLTREQEHLWEPKGAAQLIDVSGALGPGGSLAAYDFETRYPSNLAPTLALLLTGAVSPRPFIAQMGDRTSRPAYDYENIRVTVHDMAPIVRASWLRGVSAMPNVFAHESFIDELAEEAGADPVAFRLDHLTDPRAAELTRATAERAGWTPRVGPAPQEDGTEIVRGRGFAQARYVHGKWPGTAAAWSAWAAEVAVNRVTGEVNVTRVVVGQDTGMMVNPAGVRHQIHGNVIQSTSRVLKEEVSFSETTAVASREWGAYPILGFPDLPSVDVLMMDRQYEPPLGAGESASVPSAAAIVNAVYDATGVRFRELPLTPERVLAGLGRLPQKTAAPARKRRRFAFFGGLGALAVGLAGFAAMALPIRAAIPPIARPDPTTYSASTIERGRVMASLGACAVCHTAPGGAAYAGGLAIETPFGTVMSTNITPDVSTGIGNWSYPAFERAMREGLHRDGRHLYPAFPYPNFAKADEADLQALYAFLMSQTAVAKANAPTRMTFPFNIRPLVAGWNLLFNRPGTIEADTAQSEAWNRGRYLVDGLGHCSACHSPRNALGAEKTGASYLAGGVAEGWEAPALTNLSHAPIPWTEADIYRYLRTGKSLHHGTAAGPMAPVVAELRALPDEDIRAMSVYLASFSDPMALDEVESRAAHISAATSVSAAPPSSTGARFYDGGCASCHEAGRGAILVNAGPALGFNTNLHAAKPDNVIRAILGGIEGHSGTMPAFGAALDNRQLADLIRYLRQRFAPDRASWQDLEETIARIRKPAT